jgi:hypothetical protein
MQERSSPCLQPKTRMPQTRQSLNTRTATRPPQIQSNQRSKHRRPSHEYRPPISLHQHPRPLKLLLPNFLRSNISSMALKKSLAVAQGLLGESIWVAGGF